MGGLGNQMFQYACGRRLSIVHGVPLALDIGWYEAEGLMPHETYALDCFTLCAELRLAGNRRRPIRPFARVIEESGHGLDDKVRSASGRAYLSGFWQNEGYFTDVEPRVRSELSLRSCLSDRAARLTEDFCNGQSVSVHVRRASYADALPAAYYLDAVAEIQSRVAEPRFYIFSDDFGWVRRQLKLPAGSVLVDALSRDEPWLDLFAMSRCRHHIIANSTFSWWGAWLDPRPDKVVVAPRVWFFADRRGDAGFSLPAAWTRI